MALSRPYYVEMNYTMVDTSSSAFVINQCWMWTIKAMLAHQIHGTNGINGAPPGGSAWTIIQSSDGVSTSASDLWTSTFDPTKLLRANNGSAHSWIVLRSPSTITALGVPFYFLLSLSASNDQHFTAFVAKTIFSGGTNLVDPTSPDQWGFQSGPIINDLTLAIRKAGYVTDANGNAFLFMGRSGIGYASNIVAPFLAFLNPSPGDLFPGAILVEDRSSPRGVLDYNGNCISNGGFDGSNGFCMRAPGGGLVSSNNSGNGIMGPINQNWFSRTHANEITGKHDTVAANMYYFNGSPGSGAVRGSVPDWWLANGQQPVGNVEPATGPTEHMLLGNIYVPNDGIVPAL